MASVFSSGGRRAIAPAIFSPNTSFAGKTAALAPRLRDGRAHRRRHGSVQSASKTLPDKLENGAPIFKNRFQPSESTHLRKINSAETKASDKNIDAITKRFVAERVHRLLDGRGTI